MECGEQCVITLIMAGIVMMLESCADNWGTMSTQVEVSYFMLLLFKSVCRPSRTVFICKLILVLHTLLSLSNLPLSASCINQ